MQPDDYSMCGFCQMIHTMSKHTTYDFCLYAQFVEQFYDQIYSLRCLYLVNTIRTLYQMLRLLSLNDLFLIVLRVVEDTRSCRF